MHVRIRSGACGTRTHFAFIRRASKPSTVRAGPSSGFRAFTRALRLPLNRQDVARRDGENVERVRVEEDDQQPSGQNRGHGHGRGQRPGGLRVQGRLVHHDRSHHRVGVDIPVHSVLLRVHAVAHVHPTHSHAVQVSATDVGVIAVKRFFGEGCCYTVFRDIDLWKYVEKCSII